MTRSHLTWLSILQFSLSLLLAIAFGFSAYVADILSQHRENMSATRVDTFTVIGGTTLILFFSIAGICAAWINTRKMAHSKRPLLWLLMPLGVSIAMFLYRF